MPNVNKVFLMGNLTRDPEMRYTAGGAGVCEFGMASSRTWKTPDGEKREDTCFVDVSMWGRRGEVIAEHLKKGRPIFIEGRLQFDQWEGKDGQRRSKLKVVADSFEFIGGNDSGGGASRRRDTPAPAAPSQQQAATSQGDTGDDIPF